MKKILKLSSLTALIVSGNSFAIERLTPIQEPDASVKTEEKALSVPKVWLGVAGQPVNKALAAQLGVEHGVTVELVASNGSAAKAGIKKYDIITRIGDTPIKGMGDMRSVIRSAEVGVELEVELYSAGKKELKKVTLGERPSHLSQHNTVREIKPKVAQGNQQLPQAFHYLPDVDRARIEQMMQNQAKQLKQHFAQMDIQMTDIQRMQEKMQGMQLDLDDIRMKGHSNYSGTFTMIDEQGSIQLKVTDDSGKHVEVKDKAGKIIFAGPYETDEDKAAVPADVRARIDVLGLDSQQQGMGFKFYFGK